ncbi:hypothetical protein WJX79_010587 [Trebouxia sp. C0005]
MRGSQAPAAATDKDCALTPELEEGPFYINDTLFRSNITEDQAGLPLVLRVKAVDTSCNPLMDAFIDIWSCNSTGFYSGYTNGSMGPGPGHHDHGHHHPHPPNGSHPHHPEVTDDLTWLRGIAQTNEQGIAEFTTVVPGWYAGRTAHIHIKIHVPYHTYSNETQEYLDSHVVHTGQFFFEEDFYKQITHFEPYAHNQHRRVHNDEDHDYQEDPTAVLKLTYAEDFMQSGVVGSITTVIDPSATPSATSPVHMVVPQDVDHTWYPMWYPMWWKTDQKPFDSTKDFETVRVSARLRGIKPEGPMQLKASLAHNIRTWVTTCLKSQEIAVVLSHTCQTDTQDY